MVKKWEILFCDEEDKYCTIMEFIESLPLEGQVKVIKFLELLAGLGPQLRRPYSDFLKDGIHELRFRLGKVYIRMLYFFIYGDYIVFQSGFRKKTDRTPEKFINKAKLYKEKLINNYSEEELKENLDAAI